MKMTIANLKEMSSHKLNKEYDYKGHRWLNTQLHCGCRVAVCLDTEVAEEDRAFLIKKFNKMASLRTLAREVFHYSDNNEIVSQYLDRFTKELEETQVLLSQFIIEKRKQHGFPNTVDCNAEYYLLKLKQNPSCKE
jgi:hypothetical protein